MEVGEIGGRTGGSLDRRSVGRELNQVPGGEPRRDPEPPQDLDEQPGAVAARADTPRKRLLRRLHAWLRTHE